MTKIDNLIDSLVSDLTPVRRNALRFRLTIAFAIGLAGAAIALLVSLAFRPHLHHVTMMAYAVKVSYTAAMMIVAMAALDRVSRPEGSIASMVRVALAVVVIIALLAALQLGTSPASSYRGLIFGFSASLCPILIFAFGIPALVANIWFLRRAAPMNPGMAGFVGGACAGAIGGWVYSLACVENGIPFIAIWYTLGMLASGFVGWLIGRRSLQW